MSSPIIAKEAYFKLSAHFHKNVLCKNVVAGICRQSKNVPGMLRALNSNQHRNLFINLQKKVVLFVVHARFLLQRISIQNIYSFMP